MKINTKATVEPKYTHEGARAYDHLTPEQALRRSVMSCFLWEDNFYEDGVLIGERIKQLADKVSLATVCAMAVEARTVHHLRHVSLWLLISAIEKGRGNTLVADTIAKVVQRADELAELLSMYWKDGKKPLSAQLKKGLAKAFQKFDAYALAKYNRDSTVKLRDVLFLCHAKPKDDAQAELWKSLVGNTLETPDTWEVALSSGANKKEAFERLLTEGKLGYLALLRNLRNMVEAGVETTLVKAAITARKGANNVLPFRFVAAAKVAPVFEAELDSAMLGILSQERKLPGKTVIVVDISGSMRSALSAKSQMTRMDAACTTASIIRELCEDVSVYATAGNDGRRVHATKLVPARHGMALTDAITGMYSVLGGGGIFLKQVMDYINEHEKIIDRVIVITDEQDCANHPEDMPKNALPLGTTRYMLNVGNNKNGIGYGKWTHIDGFSENVVKYIAEIEAN